VYGAVCVAGGAADRLDDGLHDLTRDDLTTPGVVFQIGLAPLRIGVLTAVSGLDFASAWLRQVESDFEGIRVPVIGREDFVLNRRATGRTKDLSDVERLEPADAQKKR